MWYLGAPLGLGLWPWGIREFSYSATAGSFALVGQGAGLQVSRLLAAPGGIYVRSSNGASLLVNRLGLSATVGTFSYSGFDAFVGRQYGVLATAGAETWALYSAGMVVTRLYPLIGLITLEGGTVYPFLESLTISPTLESLTINPAVESTTADYAVSSFSAK